MTAAGLRLALPQEAGELLTEMTRIRAESGVAVLVVPQAIEGAYLMSNLLLVEELMRATGSAES